jgi:hypothetical protein
MPVCRLIFFFDCPFYTNIFMCIFYGKIHFLASLVGCIIIKNDGI